MAEVVQVKRSMLDRVYPLLAELNPALSQSMWEQLFQYSWQIEEDYVGLALVDNEAYVGFIGFVFSERVIHNNREKFCNLTAWIVKEEYRSESLALVFPVLRMKGYTITNFSPSAEAYEIFKKLGFQELDHRIAFLPFIPKLQSIVPNREFQIIEDIETIKTQLNAVDRQILEDHLPYGNCNHLLVRFQDEYCYLVLRTPTRGRWFWFTQIYSVSNPALFWRFKDRITGYFLRKYHTWMTLLDERWIDRKAVKWQYTLPGPKLYKSRNCPPEAIDYLYSETLLLNR